MGMVGNQRDPAKHGGLVVAPKTADGYGALQIVMQHDLDYDEWHWASSAIRSGPWVVLGSPFGTPVVCDLRIAPARADE